VHNAGQNDSPVCEHLLALARLMPLLLRGSVLPSGVVIAFKIMHTGRDAACMRICWQRREGLTHGFPLRKLDPMQQRDQHTVGDHEYACMHDLMMHLRNEPQAGYSNVRDAFEI
jgi:hypothetical protein